MRALLLTLATMMLSAMAIARTAAPAPLSAKQLRGAAPVMKPGVERGFFVWTDDQGLHIRWTAEGKPVLFSGVVEIDHPIGELKRVNPVAGGWVQMSESQNLLFSATATTAIDGFDLGLTPGTTLTIAVEVNGQPIDVSTVSVGASLIHPMQMPLRFAYR